jgi:hypothetical protein
MFGFLRESEIERILRAGATFSDTPRWAARAQNAHWVQFGGFVDSPVEAALRLNMAVSVRAPEKYTIVYISGEQALRRLDVRGSHTNPASTSGERWTRATHKHSWSDTHANQIAYSPPDISTAQTLEPGEHERVFNEFCAECRIEFIGKWVDPPLHFQTTLDVR